MSSYSLASILPCLFLVSVNFFDVFSSLSHQLSIISIDLVILHRLFMRWYKVDWSLLCLKLPNTVIVAPYSNFTMIYCLILKNIVTELIRVWTKTIFTTDEPKWVGFEHLNNLITTSIHHTASLVGIQKDSFRWMYHKYELHELDYIVCMLILASHFQKTYRKILWPLIPMY